MHMVLVKTNNWHPTKVTSWYTCIWSSKDQITHSIIIVSAWQPKLTQSFSDFITRSWETFLPIQDALLQRTVGIYYSIHTLPLLNGTNCYFYLSFVNGFSSNASSEWQSNYIIGSVFPNVRADRIAKSWSMIGHFSLNRHKSLVFKLWCKSWLKIS